jgi:hypothetical protein
VYYPWKDVPTATESLTLLAAEERQRRRGAQCQKSSLACRYLFALPLSLVADHRAAPSVHSNSALEILQLVLVGPAQPALLLELIGEDLVVFGGLEEL